MLIILLLLFLPLGLRLCVVTSLCRWPVGLRSVLLSRCFTYETVRVPASGRAGSRSISEKRERTPFRTQQQQQQLLLHLVQVTTRVERFDPPSIKIIFSLYRDFDQGDRSPCASSPKILRPAFRSHAKTQSRSCSSFPTIFDLRTFRNFYVSHEDLSSRLYSTFRSVKKISILLAKIVSEVVRCVSRPPSSFPANDDFHPGASDCREARPC